MIVVDENDPVGGAYSLCSNQLQKKTFLSKNHFSHVVLFAISILILDWFLDSPKNKNKSRATK